MFFSRESQSFQQVYFDESIKQPNDAKMTLQEFKATLPQTAPPSGMSIFLESLWYDAKGNWNKAHVLVQDEDGNDGAWIHAYLHRKEGDLSNAAYWYRKANRSLPQTTLRQEWEQIVIAFL